MQRNQKKHQKFQIVIPAWIEEEIEYNPQFTSKLRTIVKQYFKNIAIVYNNGDQHKLVVPLHIYVIYYLSYFIKII
jgi:hypothetical protein